MYHPSKRRKVERSVDQPAAKYGLHHRRERARTLGASKEEIPIVPNIILPPNDDHGSDVLRSTRQSVESLRQPSETKRGSSTTLQHDHVVSAPPKELLKPRAQAVTTMVAVDISNGHDVISQVTEPVNPNTNTVSVPGYGELNMTDTSTPTPSTPNANFVPGSVVPPAAIQASIARSQALATQESIANELDAVPQSTAATATPENRGGMGQSPTGASSLGSSSQQVLSSPSTPLPSTPEFSMGSSSYFTSSLSPSPTTSPSIPSVTLNPTANNSTISGKVDRGSKYMSHVLTKSIATTSMPSSAVLSSSPGSLSSQSTALAAFLFSQSTASQASVSSMAAAASSLSGFATSTRSPGSTTSVPSASLTTLPASISSQLASQSSAASAASASTASNTAGAGLGGVGGVGGVGGSSTTGTATSPTSSSGSSPNNTAPPTPVLVGGIVGGVAGLAMILFFLLILFRWRRGRTGQRRIISPPIPHESSLGSGAQSGTMTQRSSTAPIVGAILSRMRPTSSQTAQTAATSDTGPSERGFQKISGRKLQSVLASGGDGYGDNTAAGPSGGSSAQAGTQRYPGVAPGQGPFAGLAPGLRPSNPSQPSPSGSLSGSSFYRDSQGFYGGVIQDPEKAESSSSPLSSSPTTTIAPFGAISGSPPAGSSPPSRREEVANMRPGPARTPVINEPGQVPARTPSRPQPPSRPVRATPPPIADFPRSRDGLGRSHPSQDGSRGSRFREDTTPP